VTFEYRLGFWTHWRCLLAHPQSRVLARLALIVFTVTPLFARLAAWTRDGAPLRYFPRSMALNLLGLGLAIALFVSLVISLCATLLARRGSDHWRGPQRLTLSEDGIQLASPRLTRDIRWSAVREVRRSLGAVAIGVPRLWLVIPRSAFPSRLDLLSALEYADRRLGWSSAHEESGPALPRPSEKLTADLAYRPPSSPDGGHVPSTRAVPARGDGVVGRALIQWDRQNYYAPPLALALRSPYVVAVCSVAVIFPASYVWWHGLAFAAAISCVGAFAARRDGEELRRSLRHLPEIVELTDAGLREWNTVHDLNCPWSGVARVSENRSAFLLFISSFFMLYVPKSSFERYEDVAACRALLRRELGQRARLLDG
jgi:hypothetical protein